MPERKSGRQRKAIDYGKFGGDDMDDDDFADSTPPPSKKTKLSSKVKKTEKAVEKQVDNSSKRKSREDKLYERELQEALELSLSQESAVAVDTSQDELPPVLATEESTTEPYGASDTESPPIIIKAAPPSPLSPANDSDCIEILETDIVDKPATNLSKRRKTAPKKYIDSDSESDSDLPPMFGKSKASTSPAATTKAPTAETDNCIEVLKKDTIDIPASTTRRKAAPKKKYVDSDSEKDSDFSGNESASSDEDNSDDASDDDYNEADSDSDFGSSKKKTNKKQASKAKVIKKAPVAKTTKAVTGKGRQQKSGQTATQSVTAPATVTSPPLATSSPIPRKPSTSSVKTPTSTTPHTSVKKSSTNNQNWKPPGMSGDNRSPVVSNVVKRTPVVASCVGKSPGLGGVNLKSPNSGLRLGLSRNRKFKPLHPNMKINN